MSTKVGKVGWLNVNRFKGKCEHCGIYIAKKSGFCYASSGPKKWPSICRKCALVAKGFVPLVENGVIAKCRDGKQLVKCVCDQVIVYKDGALRATTIDGNHVVTTDNVHVCS